MKCNTLSWPAGLVLAAVVLLPATVLAQTPPNVGAAQSFAVLGGSSVTAAGTGTVINGDVGVSPGTSITGFPAGATVLPPFATHVNDGPAIAAQTATGALYTDLATRGGSTPIIAELGGRVLTPGIYSFTSTANIASGTSLRLSGAGIYIFQVGSALTANVLSSVVLENGASACNIFWQVTSAATLNGVTFAGTVVAQAAVDLGVGASLAGRALTTPAGAVTMAGGNTIGGCSAAAPGPGCPVITLAPATLPNTSVGTPYSQQITASGGTAPYVFTLTSGTLPTGLTLTPAGLIAGTPTASGTFTFTIRATDANGCFASIAYTIVVAAVPPPTCPAIAINPPTVPDGTTGTPYSQQFTGSGGTGPYVFTLVGGTLPAGLTLTAAGLLAGTPTTPGASTFTVRATDVNGCFAERPYTMTINAAVPTLPQFFVMLLALALIAAGYLRLRRNAGAQ
jgi:type VI secretion system secreted protein VgrG